MIKDFIILLILQLLNGFLSMYELSFVSSSRVRLENMAKRGSKHARVVLMHLKEPEKTLSAIQIGITLIGIISGVYGGGVLSHKLEPYFAMIPYIGEYAPHFTMVTVVAVITFTSLLIGEITPKSIAINNPEKIAVSTTMYISFLINGTYPIVYILSKSTQLINKLLRIKKNERHISEEEIKTIVKKSSQQGVLKKDETRMINDVFSFSDRHINELMVHRGEIIYLDVSFTQEQVMKHISQYHFSKYIIVEGSLDKILGFIFVKDIILAVVKPDEVFNLRSLIRPPLYIPEYLFASKVLDIFRNHKQKIGIVINEYGIMEGMVTLHDLVEEVFGDLPDADEVSEVKFERQKNGIIEVDGTMTINDFMRVVGVDDQDDMLIAGVSTVGGMAMIFIHDLPKEGDVFTYKDMKFQVLSVVKGRVDKLIVKK